MRRWLVKRGALYWDISERVEIGAHWTTDQAAACQFADRTSARAVRDRYPNARIVRLVPKRKTDGCTHAPAIFCFKTSSQPPCPGCFAEGQAQARAEEREAVARWLEGCGYVPGSYAPLVRSGAHREGGK